MPLSPPGPRRHKLLWLFGALMLVAIVLIGGMLLFTNIADGPETIAQAPDDPAEQARLEGTEIRELADSGRLLYYVITDYLPIDQSGAVIEGASGGALFQSCEADGLILIDGGRVSTISQQGDATDLIPSEEVLGATPEGLHKVYRDNNGDLRFGCDPDSWTILSVDYGSDGGLAP